MTSSSLFPLMIDKHIALSHVQPERQTLYVSLKKYKYFININLIFIDYWCTKSLNLYSSKIYSLVDID